MNRPGASAARPRGIPQDLEGTLRCRLWWHGEDFERLDRNNPAPGEVDGSRGVYLNFAQDLFADEPGAEKVGLFGQYGWAPDDRSEVEHYAGGGIQWTGPIPGRPEDKQYGDSPSPDRADPAKPAKSAKSQGQPT